MLNVLLIIKFYKPRGIKMGKVSRIALITIALMVASSFAAIPTAVIADHIPEADVVLFNGLDIKARPKIQFNAMFLANESSNTNGSTLQNLTGEQIDVYTNYTLCVNISDRDETKPNITYMQNLTVVGFVNFEGDPGPEHPSNPVTDYDRRNYEFQFNVTRISGGGNEKSNWEFQKIYPGPSDKETLLMFDNCSWVNESDQYNSDGVNDTIEFRFQFQLGNNSRNTNSSGAYMADDWEFYAAVGDIFQLYNDTRGAWPQWFDVYQKTGIFGGGQVAGNNVPGGPDFLLDVGPQISHGLHFSANNNATFKVNATNLTGTWNADTLNIHPTNIPLNDAGWIPLGPENTTFANRFHHDNGTRSFFGPPPGVAPSVDAFWKCDGIPFGIPSGSYTSDVTFRVNITGT
jgi:hypothetical protein